MAARNSWLHWITLAAALALLDASLTFHNVWPTPAIRWHGELSVELAVSVLVLAVAVRLFGPPSRAALRWLSALWMLLVAGRYADVTASALFGREINLYWDLRFIPGVVSLLATAAPLWLVIAALAVLLLVLAVLYRLLRWAVGRVGSGVTDERERRVVSVAAAAVLTLFVAPRVSARVPGALAFTTPVTEVFARQARVAIEALTGSKSIAASPPMRSPLSRVKGADVLLIFVESYGAVSFDRPAFDDGLASSRAALDAAIHATGRDVVSAYVESPTFGGSSWLAHISLLSGIEVRDPDTNALLMVEKRDTLVTAFSRAGYRTIALMPGLWQPWPEGAFYGFDQIYGGARFEYRGPAFGWFDIPDQFALAKFDALEATRASRPPVFLFFPTISTHTPFRPTPPYQPDWGRMLSDRPFDDADLTRAFDRQADWLNLGPSYVDAVAYAYTTLGGYLRAQADRDLVMILVGDHQPPALVSGEGAPWDVPVHVIASRRAVLDRLLAHGFRRGLKPARPDIGHMHVLAPLLLDAFS